MNVLNAKSENATASNLHNTFYAELFNIFAFFSIFNERDDKL